MHPLRIHSVHRYGLCHRKAVPGRYLQDLDQTEVPSVVLNFFKDLHPVDSAFR